ncbi:MAG TPA: hypothetical protein VF095_09455 [Bacillota bacterium]
MMLEPLSVEDVAKEIEMIFRLVDKQLQLIQSNRYSRKKWLPLLKKLLQEPRK